MDDPTVKGQQKNRKRRKEDPGAFEERMLNSDDAIKTIPMEDPEVKSRQKKRIEDFEAIDLELVDTSPAVNKRQQIIPVHYDHDNPVDPRVRPKGPIVFMYDLSGQIERSDVEKFFEGCGEILRVRFILNEYQSFDGRGYVEFATDEATHEAYKLLNGKSLKGRSVRLLLSSGWGFSYLHYQHKHNSKCNYASCTNWIPRAKGHYF
ncbi:hypothetical protein M5689_010606 [Euphorbia peplus]|nr:hypothetical protein M5689_010606 [Euphorbia peplus]